MALLGMQEVSIAFGGPPVLDRASLHIERGERVCLLGRNGAGKSTLMKALDGTVVPDSGVIVRETGASVARLEQEVPDDLSGSTFDVVAAGLGQRGQLLARYQRWRSLDTLMVAAATESLTRLFGLPGKPASALRRFGLNMVSRIPPLRDLFMAEARGESGTLPVLLRGRLV